MRYLLILCCITFSTILVGQEAKIDSLKNIVSSEINTAEKEEVMWELLGELSWTEPKYSMKLLDSLLLIPKVSKDSTLYMKVKRYQGKTQRAVGNYANSLKFYQEHFDYHKRIKDTLEMALSASQIGIINLFSGNMNLAQEYLLKSHEFYTAKGSQADIASANNGLASFYSDMGQEDKAMERYQMALDAYQLAKDTNGMANVHANMGLVLIGQKKYEEAERNLRLQGKYDSILQTNWGLGFHFDFMGYLFAEQERYEEALYNYNIALQIREGEQSHYNIDESRVSLANMHLKLGNYVEAIAQAERIFDNIEEQQSLSHQLSAYDILAEAYESIGNYKKALINQKEFKTISDSIYNRDHLEEIAENDARFNKVEQDKEIEILNAQNELSSKLISQKNRTISIGAISLVLITFLSILLYRVLSKVNLQKEQLSSALRDKDLLIKEIHHRVKNNLQLVSSLLSMQSRTIEDPSVAGAIEQGKSRVRSMALIHQDLYQNDNLKGVNVKSYLEDLCSELFNTYNIQEDKVDLQLDIEDVLLDIDTIIPLGLIINELITNSLKYAFPKDTKGSLSISLKNKEEELVLNISDDGIGYDIEKAGKKRSFGNKLIQALSRQLDGNIEIDASAGTNILITFKKFQLA